MGGKGSFTLLPLGKLKQSPERDCFLASRCRGGPASCVYWSTCPVWHSKSVRTCCVEGRAPVAKGSLDRRATLTPSISSGLEIDGGGGVWGGGVGFLCTYTYSYSCNYLYQFPCMSPGSVFPLMRYHRCCHHSRVSQKLTQSQKFSIGSAATVGSIRTATPIWSEKDRSSPCILGSSIGLAV